MHPVTLAILVACVVAGASWLAATLVGLWLAILVGLGGLALFGASLYWDDCQRRGKRPWRR
jgi:hypothetical protein